MIATNGGAIMNKKILLGIVAVIVIIIAAAAVMSNNNSPNNGEYNYSLSKTTSFNYTVGGSTFTATADTGKEFVVATITLKNVDYSNGISTNPFYVKLKVGGVSYSHDLATYNHPSYKSTVSIEKGSQYVFTVVYQVPLGTTGGEIVWDGIPTSKVVYNSALV
jgi:uncharacterized protein YxeA